MSRRKPWTEKEDEVLRTCYAQNKYGGNANRRTAEKLGRTSDSVYFRALQLGLGTMRERQRYRWTPTELEVLEKYAHCGLEHISRKLAPFAPAPHIKRTMLAISQQMNLKRLRTNLDGMSHSELCSALGYGSETLHKYRIEGLIKGMRLPTANTRAKQEESLHNPWFYPNKEIRLFIYRHPGMIDMPRVNGLWLIDFLRDGRFQATIDKDMDALITGGKRKAKKVYTVQGIYPV